MQYGKKDFFLLLNFKSNLPLISSIQKCLSWSDCMEWWGGGGWGVGGGGITTISSNPSVYTLLKYFEEMLKNIEENEY